MTSKFNACLLGLVLVFAVCDCSSYKKSGHEIHRRGLQVQVQVVSPVEDVTHANEDISSRDEATQEEWENQEHERDEGGKRRKRSFNISEIHNGGAILDEPNVKDNSDVKHLVAGMIIENNGYTSKPLMPSWNDGRRKWESRDIHKLTHKQKVMLGIESEVPGEILDKRRKKRNFFWDVEYLWPNAVVPYVIDNSLSAESKAVIDQAIRIMSQVTCIRFVPLGSVDAGHQNSVYFYSGDGCSSYIGMIGGQQRVSLKEPNCLTVPIVLHEMTHAIGQAHEQSRSDRDDYVQLVWENIREGSSNFNMKQFSTQNLNPYDLESILQYGLYSFSVNGEATMRVKDSRLEFLPGLADTLTFYDVKDITDAYKCTRKCPLRIKCNNGGFLNHRCRCYCPAGLTGITCNRVKTDWGCGGIIDINYSETITIQSPRYPRKYRAGTDCTWLIRGPPDTHIEMIMEDFELSHSNTVCYHWLEVRYNLIGQSGPKLCGAAKNEKFTTTNDEFSNYLFLKFNSGFARDKIGSKGFNLTVRSIGTGCGSNPCKMGTCVDGSRGAFTCQCNPGYSGNNCDTVMQDSMILQSDFDGELPFMNNIDDDNFDWTRNFGNTPSNGTGPSEAHSGSYYLFIETSIPRKEDDRAILKTWVKFDRAIQRCLHFHYYMYGAEVDKLTVVVGGSNYPDRTIWAKIGNKGQAWKFAQVNIPVRRDLTISIVGERGTGYQGDIAVDTIMLYPVPCDRVNELTTPIPRITTKTPGTTTTNNPFVLPVIESCPFEPRTNCFLENAPSVVNATKSSDQERFFVESADDFDWSIGTGKTPTARTGPSSAIEGTYFAYIEASNPNLITGQKARLRSRTTLNVKTACVRFNYHMYGGLTMGELNVYTEDTQTGRQRLVFHRRGNRGNRWHLAEVEIRSAISKKVHIEASRGYTFQGDIAIDKLEITDGSCGCSNTICQNGGSCLTSQNQGSFSCACPPGYSGTYCQDVSGTVNCSFSLFSSCFLLQSTNDDFDWSFGMRTPTLRTGPTNLYQGVFAYIDGSGETANSRAILTTEGILVAQQDWCLSFVYNMFGWQVGSLSVRSGPTINRQERIKISGNRGNNWEFLAVNIPGEPDLVIDIIAERGSGSLSDIAIDEVLLKVGLCQ